MTYLRTGFDGQASTWRHCELITGRRGTYPRDQDLRRSVAAMLNGEPQLDDGGATPSYLAVSAETRGSAAVAALQQLRLPGRSSGNSSEGSIPQPEMIHERSEIARGCFL